jgi:hypothetical protein
MSDETRLTNIMKSQAAVRLHTECSIPHQREEWEKEMKRRREKRKTAPKPPPSKKPPETGLGLGTSSLDASASDVSREPERKRKSRVLEEDGIDSYWFGKSSPD